MKNFLRKIPIFLTVFVLVLSCVLFPTLVASAYEMSSVYFHPDLLYDSYRAYVFNGELVALRSSEPFIIYSAHYEITLDRLNELEQNLDAYSVYKSISGSYKLTDAYDDVSFPDNGYLVPMVISSELGDSSSRTPVALAVFDSFESFYFLFYEADNSLLRSARSILENGGSVSVIFQSLSPDPGFYLYSENVPPEPLYNSAWDLFVKFIYGEGAELTPDQNLTLTLISTLAVLILVSLPLLIVFFVIKGLFG